MTQVRSAAHLVVMVSAMLAMVAVNSLDQTPLPSAPQYQVVIAESVSWDETVEMDGNVAATVVVDGQERTVTLSGEGIQLTQEDGTDLWCWLPGDTEGEGIAAMERALLGETSNAAAQDATNRRYHEMLYRVKRQLEIELGRRCFAELNADVKYSLCFGDKIKSFNETTTGETADDTVFARFPRGKSTDGVPGVPRKLSSLMQVRNSGTTPQLTMSIGDGDDCESSTNPSAVGTKKRYGSTIVFVCARESDSGVTEWTPTLDAGKCMLNIDLSVDAVCELDQWLADQALVPIVCQPL